MSEALTGPGGNALSKTMSGLARASDGLARADGAADRARCPSSTRRCGRPPPSRQPLRQTVALLGPTAQNANTAFDALDRALPADRKVRERARLEPPAAAGDDRRRLPVARSGRTRCCRRPSCAGLLHALAPAIGELAQLTHATLQFLPQIDEFDRCITGVFLPTGNIVVGDGPLSSGVPNYREFWYTMAGQAAEGQGADGNGNFLRIGAPGGPTRSRPGRPTTTARGHRVRAEPVCRRCAPGPRIRIGCRRCNRSVPCYTQPVPNVDGAGVGRRGRRLGTERTCTAAAQRPLPISGGPAGKSPRAKPVTRTRAISGGQRGRSC